MSARWLSTLALLLAASRMACGYMVGPAVPLDDLANRSDLIFQGTVVSSRTVEDQAFQRIPGFVVQETDFKPVWMIKGPHSIPELKFRHYASGGAAEVMMYMPQFYDFTAGKSYMVFAKQPPGSPPDLCRQIWMSHTGWLDEGMLLCFQAMPFYSHEGIREIVWRDLIGLLKSSDPQKVVYALKHLDELSGSDRMENRFDRFGALPEFQRLGVLKVAHEWLTNANPEIAQTAITIIGSHNPYMNQQPDAWLATVGSGQRKGFERMDKNAVNEGGSIYWRELAAVVDNKAEDSTRALAVSALGLVREPSLQESVLRWLTDPAPSVRKNAAILLADYPAATTHDRLEALTKDPLPDVRIGACYAIGFAQRGEAIDLLTRLLADPDKKVRQAAAMCLLSFSAAEPRVEKVLRDNMNGPEFGPLFLVALAQVNAGAYLEPLTREVETKADPENWSGGTIPAYTASRLLYRYLEAQPVADLQAGKFNRQFDALEIVKPNYDADPQFVYSLELRSGLTDRARKYRAIVAQAAPYDLIFLDRADKDPKTYDYGNGY